MLLVGSVAANYFYCEYGPRHTYNGLGFVWGRERGGGNWKFYVHAIQPAATFGNATEDHKWADLCGTSRSYSQQPGNRQQPGVSSPLLSTVSQLNKLDSPVRKRSLGFARRFRPTYA